MDINFNIDLPFSAIDIISKPKETTYKTLRDLNYDSADKVKGLEKTLCGGMTFLSIMSILMYISCTVLMLLFAVFFPPIAIFFLIVILFQLYGGFKGRKLKKNVKLFLREYARESGFPY